MIFRLTDLNETSDDGSVEFRGILPDFYAIMRFLCTANKKLHKNIIASTAELYNMPK